MSLLLEHTASTTVVNGTTYYDHVLVLPDTPRPGEEYGEEVTDTVLQSIVAVANQLQRENPLRFRVRRHGDLEAKEIEAIHRREAEVIARVFMESNADLIVGRQLVTIAICRWGHTVKRISGVLQALELQSAGTVGPWRRELTKNAAPADEPSYQGPRA